MQYGMIGYFVPHRVFPQGYHCDPRQPLPFACLAAQKHHLSLYLMHVYGEGLEGEWLAEQFAKAGKKLDMGKSCIRFKRLEGLPLAVIGKAIRRVSVEEYVARYRARLQGGGARARPHQARARGPAAPPCRRQGVMILVTGGAGFIGSNLVRGLNRHGIDDILVIDDLEEGDKHRNLGALQFRDFLDYRDFEQRLDAFRGERIEAVFHQGACSDTTQGDGRFMLRVNTEYSKALLAFALGRCPFLYASSAAVYGDGRRGFREVPVCEDPLNVYAFSKLLFDRHVRRLLPRPATQVVGLRYFNVYGPQENHKGRMASVVYQFHRQVSAGEPLKLFRGSREFLRDFVYVEDAVELNLHFLEHPGTSGIFNCGTGQARSFQALAETCVRHYPGTRIEEIPFPADLAGKYQAHTRADLSQLRGAGYEREFTPLEQGVAAYVAVLKGTGGYHRLSDPPNVHA
jgi:ADP-L-glycero-D-manno-heptose 6-epimerase